jgi:uncharacterized protein
VKFNAATVDLHLRVQPQASRTEVTGWQGDCLRIRLAAPPVDGAANDALLRWLAKQLGVARQALSLEQGQASRHKRVRVQAQAEVVTAWLRQLPPPS